MNYIIKKKHFMLDSSWCAFGHFPLAGALLPFSGRSPKWLLFTSSFSAGEARRGRGCWAGQRAQGTVQASRVLVASSLCSVALRRIGYGGAKGHPWGLAGSNVKTQDFFPPDFTKVIPGWSLLALQQTKASLHPCANSLLFN